MAQPNNTRTGSPAKQRWNAVTDWLGAQKPLDLILGTVTLIAGVSLLAHLS